MVIAAISLILSVFAILISLRAELHTRRQTEIMENQETRKLREDQNTAEWSGKFDEAVRDLLVIEPKTIRDSQGRAFVYVFPDEALRQRIETYLINADLGRNLFTARRFRRRNGTINATLLPAKRLKTKAAQSQNMGLRRLECNNTGTLLPTIGLG